jgi:hypothetical protein
MTKPAERPLISLGRLDSDVLSSGTPGLLLGRFDAEAVRDELTEAGLLAALEKRGYGDVQVRIGAAPGEHRLEVRARGGRINLLDLRLAEVSSSVQEPLARKHGLDVLSLLMIRWLALQHPKGRFTRDRPRLPGQRFPGLGLSKPVVLRLLHWARAWGKDGLVNVPEYYHNAVFYSAIFRFLSPERQGRFEALRRDLARLSVARASAAVDAGRVAALSGDGPFSWRPGEMVTPLTAPLQAYLDSADYSAAVSAARDAVRFRLV